MPTFSLSVNRHTEAVCRAGYKVIEVFVQGNSRKNELYLSRFLPIFEAQVCDAIAMHVYIIGHCKNFIATQFCLLTPYTVFLCADENGRSVYSDSECAC